VDGVVARDSKIFPRRRKKGKIYIRSSPSQREEKGGKVFLSHSSGWMPATTQIKSPLKGNIGGVGQREVCREKKKSKVGSP